MQPQRTNLLLATSVLCGLVALLVPFTRSIHGEDLSGLLRWTASAEQMMRALLEIDHWEQWQPQVNPERARGSVADVYQRAAPSVVVVRSEEGHGTGFVVRADGWIVTNHHVIEHMPLDERTGARRATIHFGALHNGLMELDERGHVAYVYAVDKEKDLALLKLAHPPKGRSLRPLPLAPATPPPGSTCVAIGHPAAGMLWTLRTGVVSGIGSWPRDMIHFVMARLTLKQKDAERLRRQLASLPQRRVILSTCSLNPGDSGGPLLDEEGRVIAVSFAIAADDQQSAVPSSTFAYHVHLDELRQFLDANQRLMAEAPAQPPPGVPDPWPPATATGIVDSDNDGVMDTLVFRIDGKQIAGLVFDLDQDSDLEQLRENPEAVRQAWDFEFALHFVPYAQSFYDTDADGVIDLVRVDANNDGNVEFQLVRNGQRWQRKVAAGRAPLIEPDLLPTRQMRDRLARIQGAIQAGRQSKLNKQ